MVHHLHTVSYDGGTNSVIVALGTNTKAKPNRLANENTATKQMAPLMTPSSRRRGSTQAGFRMQLLEG